MLRLALSSSPQAPLKLLCLGAHADDIEIGCGGTILRLLKEHPDSQVDWVILSSTEEREREARASAAAFTEGAANVRISVQTFRESYFPAQQQEIKTFFETLKPIDPDLIFSHRLDDRHQDHRVAGELTWNTFRNHTILEYEIPKYEGDLAPPNLYVPLPRSIADQKVSFLFRHFDSQKTRAWFDADLFGGLMTLRGVECNAPERRAEAFHSRKLVI